MNTVEWVLIAVVVVGVLGALLGWDRYRGNRKHTADRNTYEPTDEVFIDPATGRRTRVWYKPATGDRRPATGDRDYRPE